MVEMPYRSFIVNLLEEHSEMNSAVIETNLRLEYDYFELFQSAINRYEHDESLVPDAILLKYADYFDVSLDYIFGRTDSPEGKLYEAKLPVASDKEEMQRFICERY